MSTIAVLVARSDSPRSLKLIVKRIQHLPSEIQASQVVDRFLGFHEQEDLITNG
jgi:hypothetical protein